MSFLSKPFWKILCDILEKAGLRVRRLNLAYSRLSMTWDKSFNLFNHQLRHQRNENNNNKMVLFAYLTRFLRSKDASELKIKVTKSKLFSVNYTLISLTLRKKKKRNRLLLCETLYICIMFCFPVEAAKYYVVTLVWSTFMPHHTQSPLTFLGYGGHLHFRRWCNEGGLGGVEDMLYLFSYTWSHIKATLYKSILPFA